jgi:hypothetical protein
MICMQVTICLDTKHEASTVNATNATNLLTPVCLIKCNSDRLRDAIARALGRSYETLGALDGQARMVGVGAKWAWAGVFGN